MSGGLQRTGHAAPLVTVLMPVFNGRAHLREAIASVVGQTFGEWEMLIVDDGSTDGSAELAEGVGDWRIRVVRVAENGGLVAALNRGLHEARGEWIARCDADDTCEPGRLAEQVDFVRGNPGVPLIGSDARLITEHGQFAGRWRTGGSADLVRWDLCFRTPFAHSTAFFRRALVVDRYGGYRDFRACEDLDLWSRVARDFPVVTLRRMLVRYRQHTQSVMAAANADGSAVAAVRTLLEASMAAAVPGLGAMECGVIAGVWAGELPSDWDEYFTALGELRNGFLRGRTGLPGFRRVVAEQNFTLFCRARRAGGGREFLDGLARWSRRDFWALPWVRIGAVAIGS